MNISIRNDIFGHILYFAFPNPQLKLKISLFFPKSTYLLEIFIHIMAQTLTILNSVVCIHDHQFTSGISHNVPLALVLVTSLDLMRLPPNFGVLIPTEGGNGIHNPILQPVGTAVTDNMEDPLPNPGILITDHLKDPLPELIDVSLDLARAELLDSLEADVGVFGFGVAEDDVHVFSLTTEAHDVLLTRATDLLGLLLIVCTLLTHLLLL
jgi:hypothetical protein